MNHDDYTIPGSTVRVERRVLNSRFIGSATYTPTVALARAYLAEIRAEFPDATHHTYAYLVGHGASVTAGMSDDGEPSGTAGRPILAVLRGSGIGDITMVVTRYFGGTLLGTGGLVRAYQDTARTVLEMVPRIARVVSRTLLIETSYQEYTLVRHTVVAHDGVVREETFDADVLMIIEIPTTQLATFRETVREKTAGRVVIVDVDESA